MENIYFSEKKDVTIPELLSPAGDFETLKAAIFAGADAVYFGAKNFSARSSAKNFDKEEIKSAILFAHERNVKCYITVNTLIKDSEFYECMKLIEQLCDLKADAIIVQDLGLIYKIREEFPNLEIHASTQTTTTSLHGAKFLKGLGVSRVILARELSLFEISEIAEVIDTEIFVHGALCYSYSGQCLMSSLIGGRSGNRGRCAQPCRMEYSLLNGESLIETGHLLSMKDLCLYPILPEILKTKIKSLKIEGRLKSRTYVANVTRIYRNALDSIQEMYSSGNQKIFKPSKSDLDDLAECFNRTFTTYNIKAPIHQRRHSQMKLIKNKENTFMDSSRPNNRGLFIGRITTSENKLYFEPLRECSKNDCFVIFSSQGNITLESNDFYIKDKKVFISNYKIRSKILEGDRVFRVRSGILEERANEIFRRSIKRYRVKVNIELDSDKIIVKADNKQKRLVKKINLEIAKKYPTTKEILSEKINTQDHPFYFEINLENNKNLMLPLSSIKEIKKFLLEREEKPNKENKFYLEKLTIKKPERVNINSNFVFRVSCLKDLEIALENGAKTIIFGPEGYKEKFPYKPEIFTEAGKMIEDTKGQMIISTPRIVRKEFEVITEIIKKQENPIILVANTAMLEFVLSEGISFVIDHSLNVFNSYALQLMSYLGASMVHVSNELNLDEISNLKTNIPIEITAYGNLEMMVSEGCVLFSKSQCSSLCKDRDFCLKDNKVKYPVFIDESCRTHILNAHTQNLINEKDTLLDLNLKLRIDLRATNESLVPKVISAFLSKSRDLNISDFSSNNKEKLYFTKGHIFRGVE
ncbi:peptidase U32 [Thermodesulfobium narugense DSM 14796]|uniref:Peptidase U32 n=1 Tax=Thermodesulfobium narugense DSM 14796 TaxID=747365 RepID=M1E5T4_9BACT|nr:DUF3656 domain-containing protein [Thermodesulfobium narugense]AEE13740.1 peptidase U32 [Thermodesulfobium narugense DSM 14796]